MADGINPSDFVFETYIYPEIERRRGLGELSEDFKLFHGLIKLPGDRPPIILFNNEFNWEVKPKLAPGISMQEGNPVFLHEVVDIEEIIPPTVDGKRVTYIYVFWNREDAFHTVIEPYHHEFFNEPFDKHNIIRNHLQSNFNRAVIGNAKNVNVNEELKKIGLWYAPALIYYPLSKIVERIGEGEIKEARRIFVEHCNSDFIAELVDTWNIIPAFANLSSLFDECVFAHRNGKYTLSIHTLIPYVEGVIVDWLHTVLNPLDVKWRTPSRIEQFYKLVQSIPNLLLPYREILDSTNELLQEEEQGAKPYQKFRNWLGTIDPNFPARHPTSHGKYIKKMFNEENSIKLFLLLDTICQFMMFYEIRVLGRNLGQNSQDEE